MGLIMLEDRSPKHTILFPFKGAIRAGVPGKLNNNSNNKKKKKQGVILVKIVPEILTVVQKHLNIVLFNIYFNCFPKLKNSF